MDFAENYTCQVQDAVQSQHWANVQVTLHPFVIYFRENTILKNVNYLHHDVNGVYFFKFQTDRSFKKEIRFRKYFKKICIFRASQYINKFIESMDDKVFLRKSSLVIPQYQNTLCITSS